MDLIEGITNLESEECAPVTQLKLMEWNGMKSNRIVPENQIREVQGGEK